MTTQQELRSYVELRRRLPVPEMRRALRRSAGLSLRQVAAVVGVSASAVAYWETGQRDPQADHLRTYVKLLDELSR